MPSAAARKCRVETNLSANTYKLLMAHVNESEQSVACVLRRAVREYLYRLYQEKNDMLGIVQLSK